MINIRQTLTEGITIKTDNLISLYVPGVVLTVWLYVFALGEVYSNFVLKFGVETRSLYIVLLGSLILASIITGVVIDKTGKSVQLTYIGLGFCGVVSLFSIMIAYPNLLLFYSMLVGAGIGIGITGLRVYLTDLTEVDERGRIAGGLLFVSYVAILLTKVVLKGASSTLSILFFSLICFAGFSGYFVSQKNVSAPKKIGVYGRTLQYFLISWILFAGAYGIWNALVTPHPISLISSMDNTLFIVLITLGYALAAFAGGSSIDFLGRRFVIGFALAILAIGYMLYAFVPILSYLALLMEIISWGFISTIFIFVLWGEVSKNHKGLFFGVALGAFFGGFLLGESLAHFLGPVPTNYVSTIASAMLVLAIVPLIKSDEPLPKEKVKVREMASYMKDIKKLKI
jgi:MFS family permease